MKTSIFGWETKFGFVYIITLLPSHKRHNPSIYAKHFNAPGTNSSRPICKRFLTNLHPKRHRMQPWNTSASISMNGNGPNTFTIITLSPNSGVENTDLRFSKCRLGERLLGNQCGTNLVFKYNYSAVLSYGYRKAYSFSYFPDSLAISPSSFTEPSKYPDKTSIFSDSP